MIGSYTFLVSDSHHRAKATDSYSEDDGPGEVRLLCSFSHESLHTSVETNINEFASFKSYGFEIRCTRYLRLICEYELYILPDKKVSAAKNHGKTR